MKFLSLSVFLPLGERACVTDSGMCRTDGFGSNLQVEYAVVYEAVARGMTPCVVRCENRIEHVHDEETRLALFALTGFTRHEREACALKCTDLSSKGRSFFNSQKFKLDNPHVRRIVAALYRPPRLIPRWYEEGKYNVAVHFRVRNAEDNRDQNENETWMQISRYMSRIKREHTNAVFCVFSQTPFRSDSRAWYNQTRFEIDAPVVDVFDAMVRFDALITSPSSFSYMAAWLNSNDVYWTRYPSKPMPHWIHD